MESSETTIEDIKEKASISAEAMVYTMTNPYTTRDEKIEIESWYQLPWDTAGWAYLIGCVLWSYKVFNWWQAYLFAVIVGVFTAIFAWFLYSKKIIYFLKMFLGFPYINWIIPVGIAVWLWVAGSSMQAIFLVGNLVLASSPVSIPAMLINQIVTRKYQMHPKYALLRDGGQVCL